MRKDYLEFECINISSDVMFVSIGEYLCFECVEGENRAAVTITRNDLEKLLPFILKFYYNIEPNE
jgi:Holliday junction resolvase